MTNRNDKPLKISWWSLRVALGSMAIIAGIDKYFDKLAEWGMYLSPYAKLIPLSTSTLMHIIGAIEIAAGLLVFSRWTKAGSYVVMLWLIAIAVNLLTTRMFYDLAVRDVEIAVGAFVLSQLTSFLEGGHTLEAEPYGAEAKE